MKILGIDPGLATIGFGFIEKKDYNNFQALDYGIISTKSTLNDGERLSQIYDDLQNIINDLKPELVGIEELFFSQNVKTGIQVAQARGVILELINRNKIPYIEIKPNEIKSQIVGHGHAEKEQVQLMVKEILKLEKIPKPDDAADALAIAIVASYKK